jgi:hypothetical protein
MKIILSLILLLVRTISSESIYQLGNFNIEKDGDSFFIHNKGMLDKVFLKALNKNTYHIGYTAGGSRTQWVKNKLELAQAKEFVMVLLKNGYPASTVLRQQDEAETSPLVPGTHDRKSYEYKKDEE